MPLDLVVEDRELHVGRHVLLRRGGVDQRLDEAGGVVSVVAGVFFGRAIRARHVAERTPGPARFFEGPGRAVTVEEQRSGEVSEEDMQDRDALRFGGWRDWLLLIIG